MADNNNNNYNYNDANYYSYNYNNADENASQTSYNTSDEFVSYENSGVACIYTYHGYGYDPNYNSYSSYVDDGFRSYATSYEKSQEYKTYLEKKERKNKGK